MADPAPSLRGVWVTWERQRRNHGIARALGLPLVEVLRSGGRVQRYLGSLAETWRVLRRARPEVLVVQNPSVVLACAATLWGRATGRPVVVDAHNIAVLPERALGISTPVARWLARTADVTLVSNERLAEIVTSSTAAGPSCCPTPCRRCRRALSPLTRAVQAPT